MTLFAVLAKFVLMHIGVAIGAIGELNTTELLKRIASSDFCFMAFCTIHLLVFSNQWKFGPGMTKFNGRLE
jgi:hypothetical protein